MCHRFESGGHDDGAAEPGSGRVAQIAYRPSRLARDEGPKNVRHVAEPLGDVPFQSPEVQSQNATDVFVINVLEKSSQA